MSAAPILRTRVLPALAASAVAAALAGGAWYGYAALGHRPIERVVFAGDIARLAPSDLEAFARSVRGTPAAAVSLPAVREAARRIPWVRDAAVRRRYPATLEVRFETYQPLARWKDDKLVSVQGEVFAAGYAEALPRFYGPEGTAPTMALQYSALAAAAAPLASPIAELRLSARGGWQVGLDSGLTLELGRGDILGRLGRFAGAWPNLAAQGVATRHADLRYGNGFALRLAAELPASLPPTPRAGKRKTP
jgi:cell division protein FtsQ